MSGLVLFVCKLILRQLKGIVLYHRKEEGEQKRGPSRAEAGSLLRENRNGGEQAEREAKVSWK